MDEIIIKIKGLINRYEYLEKSKLYIEFKSLFDELISIQEKEAAEETDLQLKTILLPRKEIFDSINNWFTFDTKEDDTFDFNYEAEKLISAIIARKNNYDFFKNFTDSKFSLVIGRNGIGKTRWLENSSLAKNYTLINSEREISIYINNANAIYNREKKIDTMNLDNSMKGMTPTMASVVANKRGKLDGSPGIDILNELSKIFHIINEDYSMFEDIFLRSQFMYQINSTSTTLKFTDLSLGEKHLLLFLIKIIQSPDDSIILIDEPELGLNEEKLVSFFKKISKSKPKLKFVLISHSEKLAANILGIDHKSEIYWFSEIINGNPKLLKINKEIDLSLYFNILCNADSKKSIYLVEGHHDSIDKSIYSLVFQDANIIPLGDKGQVTSNLKKISELRHLFNDYEVKAIVDKDYGNNNYQNPNILLTKEKNIEGSLYNLSFLYKIYNIAIEECLIPPGDSSVMAKETNKQYIDSNSIIKSGKKIHMKMPGYLLTNKEIIYLLKNNIELLEEFKKDLFDNK